MYLIEVPASFFSPSSELDDDEELRSMIDFFFLETAIGSSVVEASGGCCEARTSGLDLLISAGSFRSSAADSLLVELSAARWIAGCSSKMCFTDTSAVTGKICHVSPDLTYSILVNSLNSAQVEQFILVVNISNIQRGALTQVFQTVPQDNGPYHSCCAAR